MKSGCRQEADPPEGLPEGEGPEGGSKGDKLEYEPEPRRVGGELDVGPQDPLRLRVLLDGSSCEVFTSTGTVLSIRTNRWAPPGGTGCSCEKLQLQPLMLVSLICSACRPCAVAQRMPGGIKRSG